MVKKRQAEAGASPPKKRQKQDESVAKTSNPSVAAGMGEVFNPRLLDPKVVQGYRQSFHSGAPFPHLQLHDVFSVQVLDAVRDQLLASVDQYSRRSNDLYDYEGSPDLLDEEFCPSGSPLEKLREALYGDAFIEFIETVSGVQLSKDANPDLSSHIYRRGDYLACHDDHITSEEYEPNMGRRIAYILYLVDSSWKPEDGGALELYSIDNNGHPRASPSLSLTPKYNSIAFFEATPTSFHSVAQVLCPEDDRFRLSISGWFAGPLNSRLADRNFVSIPTPFSNDNEEALDGVTKKYQDPKVLKNLVEEFRNASTVELDDFLEPKALASLLASLKKTSTSSQTLTGPSFLKRYHTLPTPDSVLDTPAFVKFLSTLTTYPPSAIVSRRIQTKKFESGCYTLLHDQGDEPTPAVDVWLWLGLGEGEREEEWKEEWGGKLIYCARKEDTDDDEGEEQVREGRDEPEEQEEQEDDGILLSTLPKRNKLTIVMRGGAEQRFIKMVNCRVDDGAKKKDKRRGLMLLEGVYKLNNLEDTQDDQNEDDM